MTQRLLFMLTASGAVAAAQWLNYPLAGIPRLPDGKPNLSAPETKLVLLGPCSQGRPAVESAGEGALAGVSVCRCVASRTKAEGN